MSTHLLLEAAARSLVMGAIVLIALRVLRIEQIRARRTAWLLALAGALCMPLLVAAQIGPRLLPAQPTHSYTAAAAPEMFNHEALGGAAVPLPAASPAERSEQNAPQTFADTLLSLVVLGYCTVAAVLGLRLCAGVGFAMRLRDRAERIVFPFDPALDVRTSPRLATPVTIGSTVLLPENYTLWDAETLRVVLSHERAHVRQKDFYIHVLAGLHCAMFWFNPFSWWLRTQLSELGEALSDCAAVEEADSRTSYAETLLAFASRTRWPMSGVAMASAGNLTPRIERLLNDSGFERSFAPKQRLPFVAAGVVMLAMTASTAMERVQAAAPGGPFNANTVAVNANSPATIDESTPPTAPSPQVPATPPVPLTPVSALSSPPASPSPPALAAKGRRYTYMEEDSDGGKSGDEQILAIHSDHSKLMFDSGDALPRQPGDYIYFQHDGKPYLIQDPKIIAKANELLEPMKSLREEQRDLGRQQQTLGEQQRKLASPMIHFVQTPQFKIRLAELQRTIKEVDLPQLTAQIDVKAIDEKALAGVQAHLGEIQARVGQLQAEIGRQGADISGEVAEKMGKLGEQEAKLGERQELLGDKQRKVVENARRQLQPLIEQAIREGRATPLPK